MAQRVEITLEDDLDGSKADETVQFGLDGREYEIDLNDKNARSLRDALASYVAAGRRNSRARRSVGRGTVRTNGTRQEASEIRQWAAANGIEMSTRGRVPAHVRSAYEAAQGR